METYFNSLSEDIEEIDVSDRGLTYLDVRRFKNLKILICSYNKLTSLHLNEKLEELYCSYNQLTSLHLNENLEILFCSYNQLSSLHLNENLKEIYCSNNQLTSLHLNEKLEYLFCCNNNLYSLYLNANLRTLYYADNPIYEIIKHSHIKHNDIDKIKQKLQVLNHFKYLYYCLKFKKRFRDILWVKIREPKIRIKYSYDYLVEHLNEYTNLDDLLNNW